MTRWIAGLCAAALATGALAAGLCWWAAALFAEVDLWFRSSDGTEVSPPAVTAYYTRLQVNSYAMQQVATPLLMGSAIAILVLLAVLATRWDRREGRS